MTVSVSVQRPYISWMCRRNSTKEDHRLENSETIRGSLLRTTLFYSTFRLIRKPSSGINEMQQLERKNKDTIWKPSCCIALYSGKVSGFWVAKTSAKHTSHPVESQGKILMKRWGQFICRGCQIGVLLLIPQIILRVHRPIDLHVLKVQSDVKRLFRLADLGIFMPKERVFQFSQKRSTLRLQSHPLWDFSITPKI